MNDPTGNVEKQIKLKLLVEGRDELGKFITKVEQLKGLKKVVQDFGKQQQKLRKQMEKAAAGATASLKRENKLLRGKDKLQSQISKSHKAQIKIISKNAKQREKQIKREASLVRKSFRAESKLQNKLHRSRERLNRQSRQVRGSRGSGGGGLSLGRLGLGIGGAALAFKAVEQVKSIANARRSLAVTGGLGSLQNVKNFAGKDVAIASGAQLLDQFLQQGLSQLSIGREPVITKGLLRLQESLSGVGTDLASKIILDLSASFSDQKRLKGFFSQIGRGEDVRTTLEQFQTQSNVTPTLRAVNALGISELPTTGDKILDAQRELSGAAEKLKAEFENLAGTLSQSLVPVIQSLVPELKKLATFLGSLSTKKLLVGGGIGAGALALGPALLKGGARLAGKGLIRGGGALLPSVGATGLASAATVASPIALGGAIAINASKKTEQSLREAQSASNRQSAKMGTLDRVVQQRQFIGGSRLERLRTQRLKLDRLISGIDPKGTEKSLLFGSRLTGFNTADQNNQLETLRKQRRSIQSDIDALDKRQMAEQKATQATKAETKSVQKAEKSIDNFSQKIKQSPSPTPSSKIERDLGLLFKRADLEIDALESQSQTALRRSELDIARIGPFGILQAGSEADRLLDQLRNQEDILRQILGTMDLSTREGRIQGNQLLLQIRGNQREAKELQRSLVTAVLDSSIQQAFGAGRFSKILLSGNQNAGIGLRKGVFGLDQNLSRQLLGNIDPSLPKLKSRSALEILRGRNARKPSRSMVGSNAAQTLENIGKELTKVGQQMRTENAETRDDLSNYANNRLINIQAG